MIRRLLAPLFLLAVAFSLLVAQAADPQTPAKKPANVTKKKDTGDKLTPEQIEAAQKDAALQEEQLKRKFDDVKQMILRLAQRLDSSPKPEDRDKAKVLREALNAASTQSIDAKFIGLAAALKNSGAFSDLDQLSTLIKENNDLRSELRALIDLLLKERRLTLNREVADLGTVLFHDSCYLGRHNDVYEAPRELIAKATGRAPAEFGRSRDNSFCCGAGGGRMWLEEFTGTRINRERAREALAALADTVCVSCPYCMTMFADGLKDEGGEKVRVRDIAEVVADGIR